MKNGFCFILSICLFLLSGCAKNIATPVTPTLVSTATVGKVIVPTVTHFLDATLAPRVGADFKRQCLHVEQENVAIKDITSGTMLLFLYIQNAQSQNLLLNIESGKEYKLPALGGEGAVSPSRNMFAYIEQIHDAQNDVIVNNILWVVDARADVLFKMPLNREYLGAPRWLDDNRLIMDTSEYGNLLVVNLSTREQQVISNELPNLDTFPFPGGPWWRVEYSPNLKWVIYYYNDSGDEGAVLRDIESKRDLWKSVNFDEGKPAWSPDGQEVAVVGEGQLYIINRSGKAQPVLDDMLIHEAQSPSWSPDGQQIAFWNKNSLIVLNRQTNIAVDLCIPGNGAIPLSPALWSPDSQQIIVSDSVLVDLQRKTAYKIKEITNATIFRWMNSLP